MPLDDVDRRAWHLGEATAEPDAAVAAVLDDAATRARARGAHAVAAAGFERAARLTPDPADRVQRLVSAAESAWRAGLPDAAVDLLARASTLPQTPGLRIRAAALDGAVAMRTGSIERARDVLITAGLAAADDDPDAATWLLADGIQASQFAGDIAAAASAAARIEQLEPRTARARWVGTMATAVAGVLTGRGGPDLLRAGIAQAEQFLADPQLAPWLVVGPLYLRESAVGRDVIPTVVGHTRARTGHRRPADPPVLRRARPGDDGPLGRRRRRLHGGRPARPRGRPVDGRRGLPGGPGVARGAPRRRRRVPVARRRGAGDRPHAPPRVLPGVGA